ncbi:hypothetical protein B0T24DRAFT_685602 [Lasiosphaeria ovina]|uniref:DUF7924 domain-containing protein n=1 Tax=Lasiosphaeria ovina TaxID=92902 RepID=A0AAE0JRX8_9PEZI|nr:hypothetical protein B0T24DRAFT_685602 [Lasiosphaeria ovina]
MESVRSPEYRDCLQSNRIFFRHPEAQLPDTVAADFEHIVSTVPDIPKLSPHIVARVVTELSNLGEVSPQVMARVVVHELTELGLGCTKGAIRRVFNTYLFPASTRSLQVVDGAPMARHLVPKPPTAASAVSRPAPDRVYGYPKLAFTSVQLVTLHGLHRRIRNYAKASSCGLWFPFLAVEFKADAGTGGGLWAAANECAGASGACVRVVDQLNARIVDAGGDEILPNFCYSLGIDNNLAQLYVSWGLGKESLHPAGGVFHAVESRAPLTPPPDGESHPRLGTQRRLRDIWLALDQIIRPAAAAQQTAQQQGRVVSAAAKSRPRPGPKAGGPGRKKRRLT